MQPPVLLGTVDKQLLSCLTDFVCKQTTDNISMDRIPNPKSNEKYMPFLNSLYFKVDFL